MNLISDNNDARKYRLCSVYYFLKSNYNFLYGCNEVCYAFGTVPGAGLNVCERCFLVEFSGQGKYEKKNSNVNNKKICYYAFLHLK